jgi:hypothetical protein
MATLNFNTTPRQDRAIKFLNDQFNSLNKTNQGPVNYLAGEIKALLDRIVSSAENQMSISYQEVYNRASPEDQAIMDDLKTKYGG